MNQKGKGTFKKSPIVKPGDFVQISEIFFVSQNFHSKSMCNTGLVLGFRQDSGKKYP